MKTQRHGFCMLFGVLLSIGIAQAATAPATAGNNAEALHKKECGACHTPYQSYFLPARSWEKIMGDLNKHFGENAELGADQRAAITTYLVANAADHTSNRIGEIVMRHIPPSATPTRLTETKFIVLLHREVPKKVFSKKGKLKNLSNCGACHPGSANGNYDEDEVKIPGAKNWERD